MTTKLANATRSAAANAVVDSIDTGGAGSIQIRTGSQPTNADDAASGTLLVTISLASTAFGAASNGVATLASTPRTGTAVATGTAGYARVLDGAGAKVMDCSVTATGGGGDITLASTSIVTDTTVSLTSMTYTQPT